MIRIFFGFNVIIYRCPRHTNICLSDDKMATDETHFGLSEDFVEILNDRDSYQSR